MTKCLRTVKLRVILAKFPGHHFPVTSPAEKQQAANHPRQGLTLRSGLPMLDAVIQTVARMDYPLTAVRTYGITESKARLSRFSSLKQTRLCWYVRNLPQRIIAYGRNSNTCSALISLPLRRN